MLTEVDKNLLVRVEILAGDSNFGSFDLKSVLSLFMGKLPKKEEYGEAGACVGVGDE